MTQSDTFTLDQLSCNNQLQHKPMKSDLFNRRQQNSTYLQHLQLPSLPSLTELLPYAKLSKRDSHSIPSISNNSDNNSSSSNNNSSSTNTANNSADMVTHSTAQLQIVDNLITTQHPLYFSDYNLNNPNSTLPTTLFSNELINDINPNTTATALNMGDMPSAVNTTAPIDSLIDPTSYTNPIINFDPLYTVNAVSNNPIPDYMKYDEDTHDGSRMRQLSNSSSSSTEKIYSFVAIPGINQKKRPRRRYDEVERLYHCNWFDCRKSYGTLNHLNAHITMQKHGEKRHPNEFKEMRKEWRRQKKEKENQKKDRDVYNNNIKQEMSHPEILSTYPQIYASNNIYGHNSLNDFF